MRKKVSADMSALGIVRCCTSWRTCGYAKHPQAYSGSTTTPDSTTTGRWRSAWRPSL